VFRRASEGSGAFRTELRFVDRGNHARQSKVVNHVAEAGKDVDSAPVDGSMEPDRAPSRRGIGPGAEPGRLTLAPAGS
jgi:hypothetical protein